MWQSMGLCLERKSDTKLGPKNRLKPTKPHEQRLGKSRVKRRHGARQPMKMCLEAKSDTQQQLSRVNDKIRECQGCQLKTTSELNEENHGEKSDTRSESPQRQVHELRPWEQGDSEQERLSWAGEPLAHELKLERKNDTVEGPRQSWEGEKKPAVGPSEQGMNE